MILVILLLCVLVLLYHTVIKPQRYWRNKNVKTSMTIPFFGENFWVTIGMECFLDQIQRIYKLFPKDRYIGFYQFNRPVLLLRTPEIIKQLCVKDFDHFLNRQTFIPDTVDDLFSRNLVSLKGQKWKDMRSTLSPTFTSSKMKALFTFISHNADRFVNYFLEKDQKIVEIEFKDAMSRFTNDVIASTAYGVQVDSLKDRDNIFYEMGRKGANFTGIKTVFVILFYQLAPRLAAFLGLPLIETKIQTFFTNLVSDSIDMRKAQNVKRTDVIGMLMESQKCDPKEETEITEAEEAGFAVVEEHLQASGVKRDLSVMDIAAQTFLFFIAGFEGVSNLLCFVCYELALNPDVQSKLTEEIDDNSSDDRTASYTKIMNMTYLDMVISETLRKWPFALATDREVTKEYVLEPELPGEEPVTLEPGTILMIPIVGLHRDPKYFPDPERFDPERFSPENRKDINPYAYIPFGTGPRNCIGNRFALLEVKALIFKILCHFEIVPIERTQIPLKMNQKAFGFIPTDGFHLGFKKRDK